MTVNTISNLKIEDVIGHYVEAEVSLKSYFGKSKHTLIGRIVYSEYNASLLFKPKGSRGEGYIIENENDIHSVKIIRKDNKNNKYYKEVYKNRDKFELELKKRLKEESRQRKEQERLRRKQFEFERQKKKELERKEREEARQLGGYEELELDDFKDTMSGVWTTSVSQSTLDESPMVYKPMQEIIVNVEDSVEIDYIVKPLYNFKSS